MSTDGSEFALVKFKVEAKANSEIEIWDSGRLTPTDSFTLEDSGMTFIPGVGALTDDYFGAWNGLTSELVTFSRATGELIASTPGEWPYAITRDGVTVFAADHAESTIVRADFPGLEPSAVFGPFPAKITGIAPSGDGKRLALVAADELVHYRINYTRVVKWGSTSAR